jgi:hypothetical protein
MRPNIRNMTVAIIMAAALIPFVTHTSAFAEDNLQQRLDAAESYWRVAGFAKMLDDTIVELAKNYPAEGQEHFIYFMRQTIDEQRIAEIGINATASVFSLQEIEALSAFYDSDIGQAVLQKLPKFMGIIQPAIQAEIIRSITEFSEQQ